jgi:GntP family gluconate:H+ symporter
MVEILKVDLGWSIIVGALASIPVVLIGWQIAKFLNRRNSVPLRETPDLPLAELGRIASKPEAELPGVAVALLPVLLPILLISTASFLVAFDPQKKLGALSTLMEFLGNRNVALMIGALIAMTLVVRFRKLSATELGRLLGKALETAGVIILITSAGGAFGLMLKHAGVGEAIKQTMGGGQVSLVLLGWAIACVLKFSQGSATVSMLTTAAMMAAMVQGGDLPYHPMYLFLSIGFGALGISWMNDSGFWVIGRLSGFTERETLRTWTIMAFCMAFAGLLETMLLAWLLPFKG